MEIWFAFGLDEETKNLWGTTRIKIRQGRIHGDPSRVRVGRDHFWGRWPQINTFIFFSLIGKDKVPAKPK